MDKADGKTNRKPLVCLVDIERKKGAAPAISKLLDDRKVICYL
jgi:hypothetical protein